MSLEDRIITVGAQIWQIAKRLSSLGYEFEGCYILTMPAVADDPFLEE